MALGVRAARAVPIAGDPDGVAGALVAYLRAPWSVDASLFARAAELASMVLRRERVDRRLRDSTHDGGAVVHSLVAGLAHEVRNALFGVAATLDAFEQRLGAQDDYAPYLGVLRDQVDRIAGLMRNLLDYGSPFALRLAPVSITDVLRAAVRGCQSLADARGVVLALDVQPGLPPLMLDRARMVQVFHDVVENALHFSPVNGKVNVVAALDARGDGVACDVLDDGTGFPEADLPFVFEPFFSRRRGGTGLGLAISRRVVMEHEGAIEVGNRAQKGAFVRVRLPLRRLGSS
jgi:signal transduction histidine kinase